MLAIFNKTFFLQVYVQRKRSSLYSQYVLERHLAVTLFIYGTMIMMTAYRCVTFAGNLYTI